jgi:hypothetical protein
MVVSRLPVAFMAWATLRPSASVKPASIKTASRSPVQGTLRITAPFDYGISMVVPVIADGALSPGQGKPILRANEPGRERAPQIKSVHVGKATKLPSE